MFVQCYLELRIFEQVSKYFDPTQLLMVRNPIKKVKVHEKHYRLNDKSFMSASRVEPVFSCCRKEEFIFKGTRSRDRIQFFGLN